MNECGKQIANCNARTKTIEMVYGYEDSDWGIASTSIVKLYIKKQKQTQNTNFRDIKMYGTVFDYNGFALNAIQSKTPNSCVPEYLLKLYNNPEETNPRKRLAKLTIDNILQELNMKTIDEGCSITQIAVFCDIHKITYYELDFRYKLFETNNVLGYHSKLTRLVLDCANNHLCPIENHEKRETIFRTCCQLRKYTLILNIKLKIASVIIASDMNYLKRCSCLRTQQC